MSDPVQVAGLEVVVEGGTAASAPAACGIIGGPQTWRCTRCTLVNDWEVSECLACEASRWEYIESGGGGGGEGGSSVGSSRASSRGSFDGGPRRSYDVGRTQSEPTAQFVPPHVSGPSSDYGSLTRAQSEPTLQSDWRSRRAGRLAEHARLMQRTPLSPLVPFQQALPSLFDRLSRVATPVTEGPTFFCNICLGNERLSRSWGVTGCGHLFCHDCLQGYIASRVSEGQVTVRCPMVDDAIEGGRCTSVVSGDDVMELLHNDHVALEKYRRYTALQDPHVRLCPECDYPQRGSEDNPWMTCEQCDRAFCYLHSAAHEKDESCEDYEARMCTKDKATRHHITETCKQCPSCASQTFKLSGCNHMTCRCGCDWCWLCGSRILKSGSYPVHYDSRNLTSRCAGRQFEEDDENGGERGACRIAILVLMAPFLLVGYITSVALYIALTPLALLIVVWRRTWFFRWFRIRHMVDLLMLIIGAFFGGLLGFALLTAAFAATFGFWLLSSLVYLPIMIWRSRGDLEEFVDDLATWVGALFWPCLLTVGFFNEWDDDD